MFEKSNSENINPFWKVINLRKVDVHNILLWLWNLPTSAHNAMSGVLLHDFRSLYSAQINNIMFPSHLSDTTIQLKERLDANDVAPRMSDSQILNVC